MQPKSLERRLIDLERAQHIGRCTFVGWPLQEGKSASVTHDGKTYDQTADENREQFLARVAECLNPDGQRFIWVGEANRPNRNIRVGKA